MATGLTIHGRVQGVFFRDWTVRTARGLGLAGRVRNLTDDTVEAHLEGEAQAVEEMIAAMHEGPPRERVERIERQEAAAGALPHSSGGKAVTGAARGAFFYSPFPDYPRGRSFLSSKTPPQPVRHARLLPNGTFSRRPPVCPLVLF